VPGGIQHVVAEQWRVGAALGSSSRWRYLGTKELVSIGR
jgi:hypothetical protein